MVDLLNEFTDSGYVEEQKELVALIAGELRHLRHQGPPSLELLVSWFGLFHESVQVPYETRYEPSEANVVDFGIRLNHLFGQRVGNLCLSTRCTFVHGFLHCQT